MSKHLFMHRSRGPFGFRCAFCDIRQEDAIDGEACPSELTEVVRPAAVSAAERMKTLVTTLEVNIGKAATLAAQKRRHDRVLDIATRAKAELFAAIDVQAGELFACQHNRNRPGAMLNIDGHNFKCVMCKANVFTPIGAPDEKRYRCNGCRTVYVGES